MLTCANPDCQKSFDYRQGRLLRFYEDPANEAQQNCCIKHFWLCHNCAHNYSLEYQPGIGIAIMPRVGSAPHCLHHVCHCPEGSRKNCRTEYSPKT